MSGKIERGLTPIPFIVPEPRPSRLARAASKVGRAVDAPFKPTGQLAIDGLAAAQRAPGRLGEWAQTLHGKAKGNAVNIGAIIVETPVVLEAATHHATGPGTLWALAVGGTAAGVQALRHRNHPEPAETQRDFVVGLTAHHDWLGESLRTSGNSLWIQDPGHEPSK